MHSAARSGMLHWLRYMLPRSQSWPRRVLLLILCGVRRIGDVFEPSLGLVLRRGVPVNLRDHALRLGGGQVISDLFLVHGRLHRSRFSGSPCALDLCRTLAEYVLLCIGLRLSDDCFRDLGRIGLRFGLAGSALVRLNGCPDRAVRRLPAPRQGSRTAWPVRRRARREGSGSLCP